MAYLDDLAEPWGSQPQELVEIDREHPVGNRVLAYFNAGESLRFGKSFPTTIGGTPSVGAAGKCIDYASTKTQYSFDASIANGLATAAGCAVLIVCDVDALTNYGGLFSCQDTTTQRNTLEFRIGSGATDSKIVISRGTNAAPGNGAVRTFESSANRITAGDKGLRLLVSLPDADVTSLPTIYINGIAYAMSIYGTGTATGNVAAATTTGISLGGRSADTVTPLDGRIYNTWLIGRGVTEAEGISLTQTPSSPYALFANPPIDIWVPSAGAGGTITIDCTTGNAAAAGVTAAIAQAITINAGVGDATAAGTTAAVTQAITINATVGDAAASGTTATIAQAITINTTAGNAAAAAATAVIELGSNITIDCTVANAVSAGVAAQILQDIVIGASVGNASAAGITASITTGTLTLTTDDLDAIAAAVWAWPDAVSAHAKLDQILAILEA